MCCTVVRRGCAVVRRGCTVVRRGCAVVRRGCAVVRRGCAVVRCGCAVVRRGCAVDVFTSNKCYTCGIDFLHCRHPTVPKCGGSGPCLSGGELSGVCCQTELHVLCVRVSTYTHVNRMCSFFSLSIAISRWSVLQEYTYVCGAQWCTTHRCQLS